MALESAVLLLVLSLIFVFVAGVCFVCVCLTSTPLGGLFAVALGFMSLNYLNQRARGRRSETEYGDMETSSSGSPYRGLVTPHSQVYASDVGGGETLAEAYLVAPMVAHAVVTTDDEKSHHMPMPSAPPVPDDPDGSHATTTTASSCGDYGMFRDAWCAVLFIVNLVILSTLAISQIVESLSMYSKDNNSTDGGSNKISAEQQDQQTEASGLSTVLAVFLLLASLAIAVGGTLYLTLLIRFGEQIITGMIYLSIGLSGAGCILSLLNAEIFGAIISGLLCVFSYWFLISCRDRILFASAVLKTATTGIKEHYTALMSTALLMLFTKCLYTLVWAAAFYSVASNSFDSTTSTDPQTGEATTEADLKPAYGVALFLMSVSLYWGAQVFSNVVASTVSGTLAVWWFQPRREAPVRGSLFRACTTSFGSICLGSLIVAVLHALRNLVQSIRDRARGRDNRGERDNNNRAGHFALMCGLCLAEWILAQVERLMLYFNRYAFVYSAAYGTNFATSGVKVMDLFRRRGWTAIINDDLIGNAFFLGNLALGFGVGACGALLGASIEGGGWGPDMGIENATTVLGIMGLAVGLAVGFIMTNLVSAAVASVFVYFAEDPTALQKNHGMVYDELISIWYLIHPLSLGFLPGYSSPGGQGQGHAVAAVAVVNPVARAIPV